MTFEYRNLNHRDADPVQNDALTREVIGEALRGCDDLDARNVDVYVASGEATLLGVVETFKEALVAQKVAERCHGVTVVFNQLRLVAAHVEYTSDGLARDGGAEHGQGLDMM
jgi:osmotically-inducible protein OsmY